MKGIVEMSCPQQVYLDTLFVDELNAFCSYFFAVSLLIRSIFEVSGFKVAFKGP